MHILLRSNLPNNALTCQRTQGNPWPKAMETHNFEIQRWFKVKEKKIRQRISGFCLCNTQFQDIGEWRFCFVGTSFAVLICVFDMIWTFHIVSSDHLHPRHGTKVLCAHSNILLNIPPVTSRKTPRAYSTHCTGALCVWVSAVLCFMTYWGS